jgi:hypothetical protein
VIEALEYPHVFISAIVVSILCIFVSKWSFSLFANALWTRHCRLDALAKAVEFVSSSGRHRLNVAVDVFPQRPSCCSIASMLVPRTPKKVVALLFTKAMTGISDVRGLS